jgi:hypothetical protein
VDQPRPARPWSPSAAQRHAARGPRRRSGVVDGLERLVDPHERGRRAMRRPDEAIDLLVSLRRGHRLHDGDLGQGLGQVHLQPVASQPRPLGAADVVEVQLPRHRGRASVEWRDLRLDRLHRGSRPTAPTAKMHSRTVSGRDIEVGPGPAPTSGSRPTPRGSRATTSSCASTTARRPDPDEHHEDVVEPAPPGAWPLVLGRARREGQPGQLCPPGRGMRAWLP